MHQVCCNYRFLVHTFETLILPIFPVQDPTQPRFNFASPDLALNVYTRSEQLDPEADTLLAEGCRLKNLHFLTDHVFVS